MNAEVSTLTMEAAIVGMMINRTFCVSPMRLMKGFRHAGSRQRARSCDAQNVETLSKLTDTVDVE